MILVGLTFALASVSVEALQGQAGQQQWLIPWEPVDQRLLMVHGDAKDEDGFTAHTLRIVDAAGRSLLTFDGKGRLLDMTPLAVDSQPSETLLVTHWTLGLRTTRVVVFRATGAAVVTVADLRIVSDEIGFFDLDGDGFRQMVVGEIHPVKGRAESDWPMDWVAYRWNGSTFVRAGRVAEARLTPMLRQAFGLHPLRK